MRHGGRIDSPSCTRFMSVIVFFEAFNLFIKPLPELLSRRDWFVSISSDCCTFDRQSFAVLLRFYKVTSLILWPLNTFCMQRNFPGFSVPNFCPAMFPLANILSIKIPVHIVIVIVI